jgi:hypothetical protein
LPANTAISEPPHRFALTIGAALRARHSSTLVVTVRGTHGRIVVGATVTLDGHKVGIKKMLTGTTNRHGIVTFKHVRPTKKGTISISASKAGWATATIGISVLP